MELTRGARHESCGQHTYSKSKWSTQKRANKVIRLVGWHEEEFLLYRKWGIIEQFLAQKRVVLF